MTRKDVLSRYPGAETFTFGDSRALCDEILPLVRSGAKTATCGALRDYEDGSEPMPVAGRRDIALDWDGAPAAVIETTSVEIMRFDEVGEAFALAEGEFASYEEWREGHVRYFERNGGWSADMKLVCERFRLVEAL